MLPFGFLVLILRHVALQDSAESLELVHDVVFIQVERNIVDEETLGIFSLVVISGVTHLDLVRLDILYY